MDQSLKPLIVSFYTNDWEYPDHAARLRKECDALSLDLHVEELNSTGSYRKNCGKKPRFILEKLQQLQKPLLWLDVDASILKYPKELLSEKILNYDVAAIRKKPDLDQWYVNSIWFNYTPQTLKFIDQWCQAVRQADDGVFQTIYARNKTSIRFLELDSSIHMILSRDQQIIGPNICFIHRTSRSPSKLQEKQESKQISKAKKHVVE